MSTATGTRRRLFAVAFADLRQAAGHLQRAEATWAEVAPGMKAQSLTPATPTAPRAPRDVAEDEEDVGRYQISDPTGQAATAPSAARRDEARLDELLRTITRASGEVARIAAKYAVDLPLKAKELAELKRQGEPGCEVVGQVQRDNGEPYWEPVQSTTNLGGTLPREYRLGSWALMFARRNGRVPTQAEAAIHCAGGRVMVKA